MAHDYTRATLGQLLSSDDITIKRNAQSILKVMQKCDHAYEDGACIYCFKTDPDWLKLAECPNCGKRSPAKDIEYLGDQQYQCLHCIIK